MMQCMFVLVGPTTKYKKQKQIHEFVVFAHVFFLSWSIVTYRIRKNRSKNKHTSCV